MQLESKPTIRHRIRFTLQLALIVIGSFGVVQQTGYAQPPSSQAQTALETISPSRIPPAVRERFVKLGNRLQKQENARVVYAGILRDSRGDRPIEIMIQNPGWVRITEGGPSARITAFDGTRTIGSAGNLTSEQSKLIETIAMDAPEALFNRFAAGDPFRVIGQRFRVRNTPEGAPEQSLDLLQIFPASTPFKAVENAVARMTGFDSTTSLLRYVGYHDSAGKPVASFFDDWRTTNGESHPGTIRRVENGTEVFRITIQALAVGPRLAQGAF